MPSSPGDPDRVEKIAALMDKPVKLASHREFTTWRAELDGKPVIVCSTGIGGPSTSIAVEELAQLGIRTFLRIGTTGAIQPHINVGDVPGYHGVCPSGWREPALRTAGIPGCR